VILDGPSAKLATGHYPVRSTRGRFATLDVIPRTADGWTGRYHRPGPLVEGKPPSPCRPPLLRPPAPGAVMMGVALSAILILLAP
jgi:hypothetical protein